MNSRRLPLRFLATALLLSVLVLLIGCTLSDPQSTFDAAGPVAEKQLTLFYIILLAAVFVFVVVTGILLYAVFRFRRRAGQEEMPVQTHGNTALEIGWTIAPAIVLAVIAVPTVYYIFDISSTPSPDALEVNVTGHQWWWEFDYPEQDLVVANVVTANELHVPVDRQLKVNLRSDDVIHSFWIPKLAGKVDVVPGNVNKMQFTANRTGVFFGQCAEFCGPAHAHMKFRVIVESEEEFANWVNDYHKDPVPITGKAAEGETVFASRGCLLCHKVDGAASPAVRQRLKEDFERGILRFPAPNLTNFATRSILAAGALDLNRENIKRWLREPDDVKPGNRMAQLANVYVDSSPRLSEGEINALAAYLLSGPGKSTPPPPCTPDDPVAFGKCLFLDAPDNVLPQPLWCSQCHTIEGVSQGLVGPELTHIGTDAKSRRPGMSAEDYIRESIGDPEVFICPTEVERCVEGFMTSDITEKLTTEQVDALVAFLLDQK